MKQIPLAVFLVSALASGPASPAQDAPKQDPSQTMATMMQMAQPGENHKIFADAVGSWNYKVKWWMSPDAPPVESNGTTNTRAVMDGRYFISEHEGKMSMPGPDGKMTDMSFQGMGTEGYDNVKKKYVASWIDNMGTSILMMEGTYDPAAKTLTYTGEEEPMPGMKMKIKQVVKVADKDHRSIEFYEMHGDTEVKTMEITYNRA
jgi:hypothetical protein